jgi:predicted Fe-Mo cluster-binding NifX family protein
MNKVVVTSTGETVESPLDSHFGRCRYLLVCDPASGQIEKTIANANAAVPGGAGVSTAQMVADLGIKTIITGNIGPKAYEALVASEIDIYIAAAGSVKEALEAFAAGKLKKVDDSSAPMHSGLGAKENS